jgi:hypothetical protein
MITNSRSISYGKLFPYLYSVCNGLDRFSISGSRWTKETKRISCSQTSGYLFLPHSNFLIP